MTCIHSQTQSVCFHWTPLGPGKEGWQVNSGLAQIRYEQHFESRRICGLGWARLGIWTGVGAREGRHSFLGQHLPSVHQLCPPRLLLDSPLGEGAPRRQTPNRSAPQPQIYSTARSHPRHSQTEPTRRPHFVDADPPLLTPSTDTQTA